MNILYYLLRNFFLKSSLDIGFADCESSDEVFEVVAAVVEGAVVTKLFLAALIALGTNSARGL